MCIDLADMMHTIFKYIIAMSKNVYFDVLDDIVDKYINTYHRTIKMNPRDVKPNSYAEYNFDSNEKDPLFKIGDDAKYVKIQKHFC